MRSLSKLHARTVAVLIGESDEIGSGIATKGGDCMTNPTGGPKTETGKEVARWNANRHDTRSPAPVIPGLEKAEDWEDHRDGVLESLSPEGHLELVLAERVALLSWRLHRVTRYERETIALSQEKVEDDLDEIQSSNPLTRDAMHPQDVRMNFEDAKKTHRLLKKLPKLPGDKHLSTEEACFVLKAVWNRVDEDAGLEELQIPGIPDPLDDPNSLFEYDVSLTVSLVREGISVLAWAAGEAPEDLLESAAESARLEVAVAKLEAERVERNLRNMSRERLLPDDKTLEKIVRYEAHLSRGLYQAMHELEALQTKRSGGAAPLARVDVQGLGN
jgi:hypothetical protein